jgi:DNA-binding transcriptional LysR family regulator
MALSAYVPDLTSLELLLTVRRTGGLGAAGRELGLTQQAVSARIRSLERRIGLRLLHRSSRGSTLTDAGRLLAEPATGVLDAARVLDACIAALRGTGPGIDSPTPSPADAAPCPPRA